MISNLYDFLARCWPVGMSAPFAGIYISHQTLNHWLQTVSLLLGIVVGILTVISLLSKRKEESKKAKSLVDKKK